MAGVEKLMLPTERTLAFAVTIVKSKPPELRIDEYIQLLRQHVAKGRRENAMSAAYRHLDRSSFWRSEHERTANTLRAFELENAQLKMQIDKLKGKLESANSTQLKKRKRVDEDVIPVPRSPKRPKPEPPSSIRGPKLEKLDGVFSVMEVGEIGNILMHGLYQIQASLSQFRKTDTNALACALMRAAGALPQVVRKVLQRQYSVTNAGDGNLNSVFTALERSSHFLVTAARRIFAIDNQVRCRGHVTYVLVQMYGKLVDCMSLVSTEEARNDTERGRNRMQDPNRKSTSKANAVKDCIALELLTNLLRSIIEKVDNHQCGGVDLFEGFAYTLLKKIGSRLYVLVFDREKAETLEGEIITSSETTDDYAPTESVNTDSSPIQQRDAAKLEAPYLVELLKCVMRTCAMYAPTAGASNSSKARRSSGVATKSDLAIVATKRLQRTLIDSIFGAEESNENDSLRDCLKLPGIGASPIPMPNISEAHVEE